MNYDDIINLPHPELKNHKRMSRQSRAAQFGAFRALSGHEDAVAETARLTDEMKQLDEYEIEKLNNKIAIVTKELVNHPEITVTYFEPDIYKDGGQYITYTGKVKKIDSYKRKILFVDGTSVQISKIYEIQGEIFNFYDM